jgi:SAM-dependent methyltransferase
MNLLDLAPGSHQFDAVLFTRSLHHIRNLRSALSRALDLLRPNGVLLCEECAAERADQETARWYYQMTDVLRACVGRSVGRACTTPMLSWRGQHRGLNRGSEIVRGIRAVAASLTTQRVPYLFRTLADEASEAKRASASESIFAIEQQSINDAWIEPVGLRIVARKPGSNGT